MSKRIGNGSTVPSSSRRAWRQGFTWVEGAIFFLLVLSISGLYTLPQLLSGNMSLRSVLEILVDCIFMSVAALPAWWLHFRLFAGAVLRWRIALHVLTATLYYGTWLLCYVVYNPIAGHEPLTAWRVLYNAGPNVLFYLQLFSVMHLYHFFKEREAQLKREKELSSLAYHSEINALKAQIQPHFLFNTLNSISASVPAEQERTRELIARLADTFRYALHVSSHEWVTLAEEADFIRTILELEHHRFGKRLLYHISTVDGLANLAVPSMLLQPLVENAIRHGITDSVEGGGIQVSFERQGDRLKISVADTGQGYAGDLQELLQRGGVGLKNIRRRLQLLFNENIHIEKNMPKGLIFYFFIPVQYHVNQNRTNHRRRRGLTLPDPGVPVGPPGAADSGGVREWPGSSESHQHPQTPPRISGRADARP
ncbi:histidine kinase [Chitinophaga sedimenti]|nr:histidine kinase [Chitinophaga sedimenti]MCK7554642.1 histidine kinase [Chitinophaga sedimenti]